MNFSTEQLERANELVAVCKEFGADIKGLTHNGQPVDGGKLLLTLSGTESNFGALREHVRIEKAYSPGGKYYDESPELRSMYRRWGCLAASSYGTFQIMYPTAVELGFKGHPIELQNDRICAYWATQLIVKRFIGRFKAKTLRDIFDAYNSGHHADKYLPTIYINKAIGFYETLPW